MKTEDLIKQMGLLINKAVDKNKGYMIIDFNSLSLEFGEELRHNPELFFKTLYCGRLKKQLGLEKNIHLLFNNLPSTDNINIEDISRHHLGKFIVVDGKIEKKSGIITKIRECKYECSSCGNIINIANLEDKNIIPTRCGCGRRGHFRKLDSIYQDYFELIISEDEYRLRVILGELFLNPEFKSFLKKNRNILISGYITGVLKKLPHGSESTEVEKVLIANNVEEVK